MARTVRDARLETRAARDRLAPRAAPHWRTLVPGELHLGYRRRHKNAPGSWCYRIYRPDELASGSPYRIVALGTADDYEDPPAAMSYQEAQRLAHEAADRPLDRGNLTVADAMAEYVAYLKLEKKTGKEVEAAAARHINLKLGTKRIRDLTTNELTRWRNQLAAAPALIRTRKGEQQRHKAEPATDDAKRARRATANRILTMLKAALNLAFKSGAAQDDLAWRRVKPFKGVGAARPGFLTVPEAKRLINAADTASGFRTLVHAALLTGCRYGELRALQVGDYHTGKLLVRDGKTGRRDVVLNDEGTLFFSQLCAGRPKAEVMLKRQDGSAWKPSQQARPMLDACRHAKINPAVGFHQLRHTWASLSVMAGMPLMVVARNLGHRDTRMVEQHYGHLTTTFVDKAIRASAPSFGAVTRTNVAVQM
jgi:integrase